MFNEPNQLINLSFPKRVEGMGGKEVLEIIIFGLIYIEDVSNIDVVIVVVLMNKQE